MATPGWYPDPSGQPQMFRYWDGQSWSEQTTSDPSAAAPGAPVPPPAAAAPTQVTPGGYPQQPVDPYQQQQQQYAAQPQPGQYGAGGYGGGYPGTPGSSGGGSNKGPLLIALAVLLILGLAVGGFFGVRALTDDDGDDSASDDSSQTEETDDDETDDTESPTDETDEPTESPTDEPTESPTDTGPTGQECTGGLPGSGGEVSGDESISGGDLTLPPVKGYDPLEQQITTTFAFADGVAAVGKPIEELWISLYAVGGLPKANGYTDLAASVDQVITCMTESPNFYRNFSGREDLERESITVDGYDAYSVTTEIRVDDPEINVDGDYTKVIVVDTGDDEEFGLYVAVVPIGNVKLIDQLEAQSDRLIVDD